MRTIPKWTIASLSVAAVGLIAYRSIMTRRGDLATQGASVMPSAVAVVVAQPERRDIVERVNLTGEIRPHNEIDVISKVAGGVEQVLVKVGQRVRSGQLLAVIEHREIEWQNRQARAQVSVAEATLEHARTNLENAITQRKRYKGLRADNAVPQAEFEQVDTTCRSWETNVRAAESQVELARAAAGLAGESLRNSRITTPISGVVVKSLVDVGTHVAPGQALFHMQDRSRLKLIGAVGAEDFVRLRIGQPAQITVDSIAGVVLAGNVAILSPSLDASTRRATIEIAVDDEKRLLLTNMFAHAQVEVGQREDVLSVPVAAVVSLATGRVIYVVREGKAVALPLPTTAGEHDPVLVESVLTDTDKVVISGQGALANGTPVTIVEGSPHRRSRP